MQTLLNFRMLRHCRFNFNLNIIKCQITKLKVDNWTMIKVVNSCTTNGNHYQCDENYETIRSIQYKLDDIYKEIQRIPSNKHNKQHCYQSNSWK